jgi:class 3 adenylate cyclase/predicted ATPase
MLAAQSALEGERKQVTVLFADISGFTALAETLDPEDVRQVMNACFAQLVPVVETYGGTIDKFIGDEIMALFGAPMAHDNDAERAVRAALAMQEALIAFNRAQGTTLGLHCGLNTGLVIAGGIGTQARQDYSVMGDAVNLAARLEDVSERGQIFVGPETHHLTRTLFRYEPLAPRAFKGKTDPVQVYQVLGLQDVLESHEMNAATRLPLVGRTSELALLLEQWAQATQGLGHVVVLSGEAGIGKSRLAAALGERVVQEGHLWRTIRCSPYHTNSALYPIITRLKRLLQGADEEPTTAKMERLERLLRPTGLPLEHVVPLIAALLSVPLPEERYTPLRLSPQQQKQQTLEVLVSWLLAEAAQQPVLSVWEDLHGADPSTLELFDLLLRQVPTARMLVVATCRRPFHPPWGLRSYHTQLMLSRLGPPQIEQMVAHVTAGKALPPEVMRQVMAKTDGVPLFVEECVKMILESSLVREEDGQYVLAGPLHPLAIPPTLQEALMARLDQLVPGKTIAQLGATVGREFAYELLAAISPLAEPVLQHGLSQLVEAELLYQRGHLPQAHYRFKHVLIQEAAYQSLLRSTRQQYHQRIAQVLAEHCPETAEMQPELLAHHYTEAGLAAHAIPYWQRAGQHASDRSAYMEAISHLTTGIELLPNLPETPTRTQHALTLYIALGLALQTAKGTAAPEVEHAYTQARTLCQQVGETPELIPVLYGLWRFYVVRAQFHTACELGDTLLRLAHQAHDPALTVAAHNTLGATWLFLGVLPTARQHLEEAIACYTPDQRRAPVFRMGQDPGVACRAHAAMALWLLGYPVQALARLHDALALAHELSHPFSLAWVQCWAAMVSKYHRDVLAVHGQATACVSLSTAQGFPSWAALGMSLRGWALAMQGQGEEGLAQVRQGIATWRETGAVLGVPFMSTLLAEVLADLGDPEDGLQVLTEAYTLVEQQEERCWEAEVCRLRGVLLLRQPVPSQEEAEAWLRRALDVARRQEVKSLELRAATSLARLWQQQGKRVEARELLAPVYGWFTEGFDTTDLQEAETLLKTLT